VTKAVAEGVWLVELPLPHRGVVETTNCVLFADDAGGVHLVDPGWDTPDNAARLEAGLADAGFTLADVRTMTATHLHPDHLGLATRLRAERGIPIVLHRLENEALRRPLYPEPDTTIARWGVPPEYVEEVRSSVLPRSQPSDLAGDILVEHGDVLPIPGRTVRVVHTPGHTVGSICLHDEVAGLLLTGDHVLPIVNPGLGLGGFTDDDDPLGAALDAYELIARYDDAEVLPGHGARFHGVGARATQISERHRRRSTEIAALADADPGATVWELATRVSWTGGWDGLHGFLRLSALAQTEMHLRHLRRATLES
jgi:glyoxylase-like metal-dependent hydrolase (beta-lactamase superfamily II)